VSTTGETFGILCGYLKKHPTRYAIFLGAGGPKSAGLPDGDQLKKAIFNEYMSLLTDISIDELTCEMLLEKLCIACGDSAVGDSLQKFLDVEVASPSGYQSLVRLVRFGYFGIIITVNIDELLETSFIGKIRIRTITTEEDQVPLDNLQAKSTLMKLHGTISKPKTILATIQNVQDLVGWKKEILEYILKNFGLIFIGYSARDPDILNVLKDQSIIQQRASYNIHWVDPYPKPIHETILKAYRSPQKCIKVSSDGFFELLERGIKLSVPIEIGVLNGMHTPDNEAVCKPGCSSFPPKAWADFFEKVEPSQKYRAAKIAASQIDDRFAVIINPFGEAYPELNRNDLATFKSIKNYIANGGIFVNTGGLAFFYWDSPAPENVAFERIMILPRVTRVEDDRVRLDMVAYRGSLDDNLLSRHFGIRCTLGDEIERECYQLPEDIAFVEDIKNLGRTSQIAEFRAISKNRSTRNIIPLLRSKRGEEEVYPIAAVPYEAGILLLAGMNIRSDSEFSKTATTVDHVLDREREKLFMEFQKI